VTTQQPVQPPSPWIRVVAALGAVAVVGASIVLSNSTPAAAAGLEAFASCDDLRAHLETATAELDAPTTTMQAADVPSERAAAYGAESADGDQSGGTNTQVAGIDELDIVEVLTDGRVLAARQDRIALIDASGTQILASLDTTWPTQITFDDERATLWAVGSDGQTTTLTRAVVDGDSFTAVSHWELAGRLVDLRRDGGRVHLVAVDDDFGIMPMAVEDLGGTRIEGQTTVPGAQATLPFAGTSPVACDQVLHSPLPGGPATTLVASFDATGELAPVAATEIVGAGDNVLVTDTALYVSTPSFDGNEQVTGIHRFSLDGLTHTGSGSVTGRLLNQFSLDEHAGHLRAAVTVGDGMFVRGPIPVEGDFGVATGGAATQDQASAAATAPPEPPVTETTVPEPPTTEPTPTTGPTTTTEPTTTTTIEPTTTTAEPTTTTVEPTTTIAPPVVDPNGALNEIVTFDLDGTLDIVGRSPRFGHAGETLQGIRFDGDIAYAVTFLQTDPLYVIDLSQPTSPVVLGQIEIPGFSAYLHPISATQVIGFGPGGDGQILARLFDITDPSAPQLLDTTGIGEDSPIVYDHHALRSDGDRLLVASNRYISVPPARCSSVTGTDADLNELYRQMDDLYRQLAEQQSQPPDAVPPEIQALQTRIDALAECLYPSSYPQAQIVVLTPSGASLQARSIGTDASDAQRILPVGDGYLVVGSELTRVDGNGATQTVLT
jgi:uncharacterized secreted protein with C-terminal beta-propeller domain